MIDAREQNALAALVVAEIALDGLPQKLGPGDALFPYGDVDLLKHAYRQIEQDGLVVPFWPRHV